MPVPSTQAERGHLPRSQYLYKLSLYRDEDIRRKLWQAFSSPVPIAYLRWLESHGHLNADLLIALELLSDLERIAGHRKLLNERSGGSRYNNITISEAWRVLWQHGESISGLARQLDLPKGVKFDTARKKVDERVRRVGFAFEGRGKNRRITHGPCCICRAVMLVEDIYEYVWLCGDCYTEIERAWVEGEGEIR